MTFSNLAKEHDHRPRSYFELSLITGIDASRLEILKVLKDNISQLLTLANKTPDEQYKWLNEIYNPAVIDCFEKLGVQEFHRSQMHDVEYMNGFDRSQIHDVEYMNRLLMNESAKGVKGLIQLQSVYRGILSRRAVIASQNASRYVRVADDGTFVFDLQSSGEPDPKRSRTSEAFNKTAEI